MSTTIQGSTVSALVSHSNNPVVRGSAVHADVLNSHPVLVRASTSMALVLRSVEVVPPPVVQLRVINIRQFYVE